MELTFEEIKEAPVNFLQKFEEAIPDDATCISVKVNIQDLNVLENCNHYPAYGSVVRYLKDCGVDIIAVSSGLHLNGNRQIPHIHYHFIVNHYNAPSNPSQHRRRWLAKSGNETETFADATFKYQALDPTLPKYQFLAYPLKESKLLKKRNYTFKGEQMSLEMISFLMSVGETIYQTALALRERQDKCTERKQLALKELYEICKTNTFSNYKQMMTWLDTNYIDTLELEEMPDPKNYKVNCQKVAVKLKLLKYSEL